MAEPIPNTAPAGHANRAWVGGLVVALASTGLTMVVTGNRSQTVILEMAFYTIATVAMLRWTPLGRFLASMPRLHLSILAVLVGLMLAGQVVSSPRRSFPFVLWNMYGSKDGGPTVTYCQVWGVRADGSAVRVEPADLFASLGSRRIDSDWPVRMRAPLRGDPNEIKELLELLKVIGKTYNRQHPDAPIHRLDVIDIQTPLERDAASGPDKRRVLIGIDVEPAP